MRDGASLPAALGSVLLASVLLFYARQPVSAQEPDQFPLLKSCTKDAEILAMLDAGHTVKVRFNYAGDAGNCYAVTATVGGNNINGYLIGAGHPAVAAFEKEVRSQSLAIPAPAPSPVPTQAVASLTGVGSPNPSAESAPAPLPLSFAGFHASSVNGGHVDLSTTQRAPNVVLYFWSARTRSGIKTAERMDLIYDEFHNRGVDVVGVASAASMAQLIQVCKDNEIVWPQVLDSGAIAARYHVSPSAPFLLLDQSRKVIAAVASPGALAPLLTQITKYRRVH